LEKVGSGVGGQVWQATGVGAGQGSPPLGSYAAFATEALEALSPEECCKVYVILNLASEAFADGSLKISCAFGEETPVWEDGRTSTR
jgi:hypothetical protein